MAARKRAVLKNGRTFEGPVVDESKETIHLLIEDPDVGMEVHVEKDKLKELTEVF